MNENVNTIKNFVSAHKKKIIGLLLLIIVLGAGIGIGEEVIEAKQDQEAQRVQTDILTEKAKKNKVDLISEDTAKEKVAQSLSKNASDLNFDQVALEERMSEDNSSIYLYNIEVRDGLNEYDFNVDAESGEILAFNLED